MLSVAHWRWNQVACAGRRAGLAVREHRTEKKKYAEKSCYEKKKCGKKKILGGGSFYFCLEKACFDGKRVGSYPESYRWCAQSQGGNGVQFKSFQRKTLENHGLRNSEDVGAHSLVAEHLDLWKAPVNGVCPREGANARSVELLCRTASAYYVQSRSSGKRRLKNFRKYVQTLPRLQHLHRIPTASGYIQYVPISADQFIIPRAQGNLGGWVAFWVPFREKVGGCHRKEAIPR